MSTLTIPILNGVRKIRKKRAKNLMLFESNGRRESNRGCSATGHFHQPTKKARNAEALRAEVLACV
jgi:hypothetical protein